MKKFLKYLFLTISLMIISSYAFKIKLVRRLTAPLYFDEKYYVTNYPSFNLYDTKISPLQHYIKIGWKTYKSPNKIARLINQLATKYLTGKKVVPLKNPKYYLSLAAMFQNEAKYLKEWIEFHRLVGVEHFYLYNHLSTDNYREVLEPYVKQGIVELKDVTDNPKERVEFFKFQTSVHNNILRATENETEWLMVIDTDEFLFPVKENNLQKVLKDYDNYASVSVNWRLFSPSTVEKIPANKLLIETLVESSSANDLHVKSILKPRYAQKFIDNTHFAKMKPGYYQITENFDSFYGPFSPSQSLNILRINHYWTRDLDFFKTNKLSRPHIKDKLRKALIINENSQQTYNQIISEFIDQLNKDCFPTVDGNISPKYDDSILRFVEPLRQTIFGTSKEINIPNDLWN